MKTSDKRVRTIERYELVPITARVMEETLSAPRVRTMLRWTPLHESA